MTDQEKTNPLYKNHDCCTGALIGMTKDGRKLKVIPTFCNKWTCAYCIRHKTKKWRSIAVRGNPERFITLTIRPDENKTATEMCTFMKDAFKKLVQRIRRKYGDFQYMAVWELTKKGTPHVHILQRGTFIPQKWLKDNWCDLTGSFIVDVRKVKGKGHAAQYLTNYLSKDIGETSRALSGKRLIQKTRDWIVEDPDQEEGKEQEETDEIDEWIFMNVTPAELIAVAGDLGAIKFDPASTGTLIIIHVPPDEDFLSKLQYYFDETTPCTY